MTTAVESAVENSVMDIEALWLTSYRDYARDLLKIQPLPESAGEFKIGGTMLCPLVFNEPQSLLDGIIQKIRAEGRLVRLVILKARREGVSTYVSGRYYWMTTTRFNRYSMLITHEPEASEFLFQMHKRFLMHNPVWKPATTYNNKRLLNFDTPDGTGLGSAIRVATAGKEDIGSGQLIHYLHLSEMAKWPAHTADAIMTSVMQCVPDSTDTEVVIESTAKGVGGQFHDMYWDSWHHCRIVLKDGRPEVIWETNEDGDPNNEFTSVFIPWYVFERYQREPSSDFERTEHEQVLVDTYGLTDRHLAWRRWCIATQCRGSEDVFKQEYPSCAIEAFLASGEPVFDRQQLVRLKDAAPKPKARYTIRLSDGQFIQSDTGELCVWEEPIGGEEYIIGADVSEGINKNTSGKIADFSAACVCKISTGEQVAEWHGKIDPDLFGVIMAYMGRRYNVAWLVPERNNHGNATVLKLVDINYPRIYVERVPEPPNKTRKRYGWLTTRASKKDLVDNGIAEMRDGTHGFKSKDLFFEMMAFSKEGQEYGAEVGKFDDRVMAALIAKFNLPRFRRRSRVPVQITVTRPAAPPASAWMI